MIQHKVTKIPQIFFGNTKLLNSTIELLQQTTFSIPSAPLCTDNQLSCRKFPVTQHAQVVFPLLDSLLELFTQHSSEHSDHDRPDMIMIAVTTSQPKSTKYGKRARWNSGTTIKVKQ